MTKLCNQTPTELRPVNGPISKSDLARLKGCTRQRITKLVRTRLAPAVLEDGSIDASHPAVQSWLAGESINGKVPPPFNAAQLRWLKRAFGSLRVVVNVGGE